MKRLIGAGLVTVGLIFWAHQLPTIGGRVPMVFVALWFGSATIVALIFVTPDGTWHDKLRVAACSLLPFALVPLLEARGVANDPAVWLLDSALFISICSVPYFTLVARSVLGGVALSVAAFQALWIGGASACFRIMDESIRSKGGQLAPDATFEEFFRNPDYRYLFYVLCAVMMAGYCPALLWLGKKRFLRQVGSPDAVQNADFTAR